jgi:hypothetical protein
MLLFPIPTVVRTETEDGSFIRIGDEVFSLRRLYGDSKAVTRQELAETAANTIFSRKAKPTSCPSEKKVLQRLGFSKKPYYLCPTF